MGHNAPHSNGHEHAETNDAQPIIVRELRIVTEQYADGRFVLTYHKENLDYLGALQVTGYLIDCIVRDIAQETRNATNAATTENAAVTAIETNDASKDV